MAVLEKEDFVITFLHFSFWMQMDTPKYQPVEWKVQSLETSGFKQLLLHLNFINLRQLNIQISLLLIQR